MFRSGCDKTMVNSCFATWIHKRLHVMLWEVDTLDYSVKGILQGF